MTIIASEIDRFNRLSATWWTSSMGVKVNDAKVIKTDVMASNGVIRVIDTVVVPN